MAPVVKQRVVQKPVERHRQLAGLVLQHGGEDLVQAEGQGGDWLGWADQVERAQPPAELHRATVVPQHRLEVAGREQPPALQLLLQAQV